MRDLLQAVFGGPGPVLALLEASAGTGKTYTIERLVLDRVRAGVPIQELLLVTFTEKAAAELRDRVRTCLASEGAGEAPVRRALAGFDAATITTLHGFAQRALSWFSIHTPYPVEQELAALDELLPGVLRDLIRGPWHRDPLAAAMVEDWLVRHGATSFRKALRAAAETASPLRFERRLAVAGEHLPETLASPRIRAAFEAVLAARAPKGDRRLPYTHLVHRVLEHGRTWQDCLLMLAMEDKRRLNWFIKYCEEALPDLGTKESEALLVWLGFVRVLAGHLKNTRHLTVMALWPSLREALEEEKRRRHVLTYQDMIRRLAAALADPELGPGLVARLRERFSLGIVDEFQDTDALQWDILQRIFLDREGGGLVVVGDPKQAIYRFRGADIMTYLEARGHLEAKGGVRVHLDRNFRCTAPMVDAVNHFFGGAGPDGVFTAQGVRYDHPVACGRPGLRLEPPCAPVVILGQRYCPHFERGRWRFELARQVAGEIRALLERHPRLVEPDGSSRPLDYRDVFILVQKHAEGRTVAGVLREEGIPFAFYKRQTLFDGPEARALLDVLEAVLRPQVQGLRHRAFVTPFFGIDPLALARADGLPRHHPIQAVLDGWAELAQEGATGRLLQALWLESGVRERLLSCAATRRDAVNLERIFEILRHDLAARPLTPEGLTARLRDRVLGRDREAGDDALLMEVTDPDENAVRILTMHNAKGLEAPVVFLYGGFSGSPPVSLREYHSPGEGRRILHVGSLDPADPDRAVCDEEELGDAQRLMYVAMTRAKALCFLQTVAEGLPDPQTGVVAPDRGSFSGAVRTILPRVGELRDEVAADPRVAALFELRVARKTCRGCGSAAVIRVPAGASPTGWTPDQGLLALLGDADASGDAGPVRAGAPVFSYSGLKRHAAQREERHGDAPDAAQDAGAAEAVVEDAATSDDAETGALPEVPGTEPPPGVATGLCVHELCEKADPAALLAFPTALEFLDAKGTEAWVRGALTRQGLPGTFWRRVGRMVFDAYRTPIELDGFRAPELARCERLARELEFRIPYDEALAAGLTAVLPHPPREPGWVMGFFDAVLLLEGRLYLVDWKTDWLRDYGPDTVAAHVRRHYALQARLYAAALARMLGIRSAAAWEATYGGFLYVFMRGFGPGTGVVRLTSSWEEVSG